MSWRTEAACAGQPLNLFFPNKGARVQEALELCAQCPVIQQCALDAVEVEDEYGVRGGVSIMATRESKMRLHAVAGVEYTGPKLATHCRKGHAMTPDNIRLQPHSRTCRTCSNEAARVLRAKKRAG